MGRGRLIKALAGETARDAPMADTTLPHPTRGVTEAADAASRAAVGGHHRLHMPSKRSSPMRSKKTLIGVVHSSEADRRGGLRHRDSKPQPQLWNPHSSPAVRGHGG